MDKQQFKIAIIGGGIAGTSIALYLGELGLDVTLLEKKDSLVDGPPICHLHAGGNLYREISDEQCIELLNESIELVRLYPAAVDFRPTLIAVPKYDDGKPEDLFDRLKLLEKHYKKLIDSDIQNRVLGAPQNYYKIYSRKEVEALRDKEVVARPISFDEWMIPVAKNLDLDTLKFPLVMVQEYGLNVFRLGASVSLALSKLENVNVSLNSKVCDIKEESEKFKISWQKDDEISEEEYDFIINAAGFKSGEIDDMLGFKRQRFVEFKAAYVTSWDVKELWPEVIFHGVRGTPQGMAQFTPYPDGYIQLHGMTENITLFEDGLVQSCKFSAQPKLGKKYIDKIYTGWRKEDVESRTSLAIEHISKFIPSFKNAKVASKPLYGAQQIPGDDASLRAVGVSFETNRYARCENVKASSVLGMGDEIVEQLIRLNVLNSSSKKFRKIESVNKFLDCDITDYATKLCEKRSYPSSMGKRYNNSIVL